MAKLERIREAKAVVVGTVGAAIFISAALLAEPRANGSDQAVTGSQRLGVVGEVLVAADESPDGPGVSESALAIVPVDPGAR